MSPLRIVLTVLVVALCACEIPRTEVVVRVYGDLEVQQKLSSLTISVWSERNGRWQEKLDGAPTKRSDLRWPVEVGVLSKGDHGERFEVTASALDTQGKALVSDRALVRFSANGTRVIRLDLRSQCMRREACDDPGCHGTTCQVCRADGEGALCVKSEERPTERYTKATYAPTQQGSGQSDPPNKMPVEGEPCADDGARACVPTVSQARLLCTKGSWHKVAPCAADEVCSEGPSKQGTCVTRCKASSGQGSFCLRSDVIEHCAASGERLSTETCRAGLRCAATTVDQASCADIDECAAEPKLCAPGSCVNNEGGYRCDCPPGYTGELHCQEPETKCDYDLCSPGVCERPAPGIAEVCKCPPGYMPEEGKCLEIDECAGNSVCDSGCANTEGSFSCECGTDTWCDHDVTCRTSDQGALCVGELADWPMPNSEPGAPNQASYAEPGDGTIADLVTGLVWLAEPEERTWREALDYCDKLEFAGESDWRLPSVIELISILDYRWQGPACDLRFGGSPTRWEWSNGRTNLPYDAFFVAHAVDFREGRYVLASDTAESKPFRCVRGPKAASPSRSSRYQLLGAHEELVADHSTQLVWVRSPSEPLSWAQASAHCSALELAGHDDFRLATLKELHTLYDPRTGDQGRSPMILGDASEGSTWSATTINDSYAWSLSWPDRYLDTIARDEELEGLCVRQLD